MLVQAVRHIERKSFQSNIREIKDILIEGLMVFLYIFFNYNIILQMANFGRSIFDNPQPLSLSFPEPFYEVQSEYSYPVIHEPQSSSESLEYPSKKQEIKTTDLAQDIWDQTERKVEKTEENRSIKELDCEVKMRDHALKVQRGSKDDTVLLNINFKTILVSHFREKMFMREMSQIQKAQVDAFVKRPPSFKSLSTFCRKGVKGSTIRNQLVVMVESGFIVKKILESRCMFETKRQMLKFLDVFRRNIVSGAVIRWKDAFKK